jgi:hypothetical protein
VPGRPFRWGAPSAKIVRGDEEERRWKFRPSRTYETGEAARDEH